MSLCVQMCIKLKNIWLNKHFYYLSKQTALISQKCNMQISPITNHNVCCELTAQSQFQILQCFNNSWLNSYLTLGNLTHLLVFRLSPAALVGVCLMSWRERRGVLFRGTHQGVFR